MHLNPAWQAQLDDFPTALAVSRDGSVLAAGSASGRIHLFDASAGDLLHTFEAHANGVLALSFGRDRLASGGQDGHARLWDFRTGTALAALPGGGSWVSQLAFTPDGKKLATASGKQVKLWNADGSALGALVADAGGVNGMAWNAVGGLLAVVAGAEVQLWRVADVKLDRRLKWASTLLNIAWSPDGQVIACGSLDKSVHFWRTRGWLDSQMGGYAKKPQAMVWTGDSRWLATTGEAAVIAWTFAGKGPEGTRPLQLDGHALPPDVLAAHPKKALLLSGAKDRSVVLWSPRNGETPQAQATLAGAVSALQFNPTLAQCYAAAENGQLAAYWMD
jgi:WD40 repeat protein